MFPQAGNRIRTKLRRARADYKKMLARRLCVQNLNKNMKIFTNNYYLFCGTVLM